MTSHCPLCKQVIKAAKVNKYRNTKVVVAGIKFDSIKESRRYFDLFLLSKVGKISELKRQIKFELIPRQRGERAMNYYADFTYYDAEGNYVVEDVKSSVTRKNPAYIQKRKLMLQVHGIKIKEV